MPWACPDYLEGLTGLRQFGVGSRARSGAVLRLSHFTSSVGEDRLNPLRFRGWVAGEVYRRPMTPIPAPGDPCAGFAAEPMKCWAMIYDGTMQADRGPEQPNWTGRWFSPRDDPASRRTVLASGDRSPLTLPRFGGSEEGCRRMDAYGKGHSEWRITLRPFAIAPGRWLPSL